MKSRTWLWLLIIIVACHKDDDEITTDDMWIYANHFFDEAAARNITLDKTTLTIKFVEKAEIAPYAGYGNVNPPLVRIVKDYWINYSSNQKEILMFHELGHAMLARQHTNEMLPNCVNYKSMMMDGNQFIIYGAETDPKRQYYLDELFNPTTPYPSWAGSIKSNKTSVLDSPTTGWEFFAVGGSPQVGNTEDDNSFHISGPYPGSGQSFWKLTVPSQNLPVGSTIALTFQIKTADVTGQGATATLQPDLDKNKTFWTSTVLYSRITDTDSDWKTFQLILNCYPADKPEMFIYLGLSSNTTGDVWFRNIKVDYYN